MELDAEMIRIISDFAVQLNDEIADSLEEIGQEAVQELAETSPKDTGQYSRSWVSDVRRSQSGTSVTVHNRKYQLTHLLENGTTNADGTQRTRAQVHISPANEHAQRKAFELMREE